MAVSEAIKGAPALFSLDGLTELNRDYIGRFCKAANGFLRWEREQIIKREASPEDKEKHRRGLLCLLRGTRWLLSMVSDPDYPDHSIRPGLEHELWRLEQSWQAIYEPMPEVEANKLMAEAFPDEFRA